jgi:predicted dienelactone hydrolase
MKRILCAFAILLSACASQPSKDQQPAAQDTGLRYSAEPGESPVGVIPAGALRDSARNKDVGLYIEYPTRGGPHPVIIFSHAYGASPARSYVGLSAYWASHGYVVIKPTHNDAGRLTAEDLGDPAKLAEAVTAAGARDRADDIRLILDSLSTLEQQYPELQGKMDAARIGVGGHSYGAFAALLLAGARTFIGATPASAADPRVKVVLALSPQGVGESRGLTRESWTEVRIPVLFMTGSNDRGANEGEDEAWRRQAFELSPAGDKWFISIAGANHFTFTGGFRPPPTQRERVVSAPPTRRDPRDPVRPSAEDHAPQLGARSNILQDRNIFNVVKSATRAFWDAYLKNEPKGREYLTSLSTRQDLTIATK